MGVEKFFGMDFISPLPPPHFLSLSGIKIFGSVNVRNTKKKIGLKCADIKKPTGKCRISYASDEHGNLSKCVI